MSEFIARKKSETTRVFEDVGEMKTPFVPWILSGEGETSFEHSYEAL